jgi:hypothetical protein
MAADQAKTDELSWLGACVLGGLGSLTIWLTIGGGPITSWAWIVIAVALVVGMRHLPAPIAGPIVTVCRALGYVVGAILMGLLLLGPGALAYGFSRTVVETFPRWLQVATLLVWFLLLVAVSLLLYSRALRHRTGEWLRTDAPKWLRVFSPPERLEVWGAIALYINFVVIAMGCFAGIAFLLHGLTPPLFLPAARPVEHGSLADFLLWQLLDAIPGLNVTETLRWPAPLTYERGGAGWLVLLFKIMVIVPVVSGIGHYLKDEPSAAPANPSRVEASGVRPAG